MSDNSISYNDYSRTYSNVQYAEASFPTKSDVNTSVALASDFFPTLSKSSPTSGTSMSRFQDISDPYTSQIEKAIIGANNPLTITDIEEINVNGVHGYLLNKQELSNWNGSIPLNQYQINDDPNPQIINKKSEQELEYIQEMTVRYLRPPTPPPPGEIFIKEEQNVLTPPAPPVVIRQLPPQPETPEPIIIREAPPEPPQPVGRKIITISGKRLPPPPRKLVVERFEPLPAKPQQVMVERWLPYIPQKRKVIFQAAPPDPHVIKPRNVIIQWQAPKVIIKKQVKYLGIEKVNPADYVREYGATIRPTNTLPDFVNEIKTPDSLLLAAAVEYSGLHELEGDVHALKLVDLEREGLGEYRQYLEHFSSRPSSSIGTSTSSPFNSFSLSTVTGSNSLPMVASNNMRSPSVISQSPSLVPAPIISNETLPYRSITALSSLNKVDQLGFPRADSAIYQITTVNDTTDPANLSAVGYDFDPSSRAVSRANLSNVSGFVLRSRTSSISTA